MFFQNNIIKEKTVNAQLFFLYALFIKNFGLGFFINRFSFKLYYRMTVGRRKTDNSVRCMGSEDEAENRKNFRNFITGKKIPIENKIQKN